MSKIVNGYVFPPPLLFPPPSESGSRMMYPATRYGQDYLSSGPPTFDEHLLQKPNFNGQGQSWSHCPEPHFSSKIFRPQFHPRMHVYDHRHNSTWVEKTVAEREAFPNDASHCRRPGRPFKQANDRRNNHFKQNGWNSSNTVNTSDGKFFCEPCEKEFKSENDKVAHVRQHIKCEVEGCNFIASRKTIKLHYIQNHEVGKFRIVLKSDGDIEKWREERKRNYPSASKKSEKLAEEESRRCHGIVLKRREFSYKGNGKWNRKNFDKPQKVMNQEPNNSMEREITKRDYSVIKTLGNSGKETEKHNIEIDNSKEKHEVVRGNGLDSLKQMYDSSENEESGDEAGVLQGGEQSLQQLSKSNHVETIRKEHLKMDTLSIIKKESDDEVKIKCDGLDFYRHKDDVETGMTEMLDLKNGYHLSESNKERINKRPIEQEGRSLGQNSKQVNENKVFEQNRKRKYSERSKRSIKNGKRNSRPTLLEMLLAKDIKHERNVILQCIRFIKKNNFLKIDAK